MSAFRLDLRQADPEVVRTITPALVLQPRSLRARGWSMARWLLGGAGLSLATSCLVMLQQPNSWIGPVAGGAIYVAALAAAISAAQHRMRAEITSATAEELRIAAELPTLTRSSVAYLRALAAVANAAPVLGESLTADLLAPLNELVRECHQLDAQRGQLAAALGSTPLAELERERAELEERLRQAPDAETRRALAQSVALCDGRLAHARGLAPGLARLEAQQEVIYQTLAAAETSLRRLKAAPAGPALSQVDEIRRSTAEVTAQTRAVEEAVQEVVALGGG